MIDVFEKTTIQDLGIAKALGVDEEDVKRLSLCHMKNEMHNKAFHMRDNKQTITQEEADQMNKKLQEIINQLMEFDYEPMDDYIIDFNSFVKENPYYNTFMW